MGLVINLKGIRQGDEEMNTIVILISKLLYLIGKLVGKGSSLPRKDCT